MFHWRKSECGSFAGLGGFKFSGFYFSGRKGGKGFGRIM